MKSFNKNVTSQMKAIALLMMLVHHLWQDSEFGLFEPVSCANMLLSIGLMCKICVGIFMFLSGYGLMASSWSGGADYSIVNRLKKVLLPFWLIVVLAAPFLLLYDDISWYDVVTDSLLLTSKMNGSWWFMQTYVIFVICFPLFAKSLHYKKVWIPLLIVSVLCFQPIATDIRKYSDAVHYVLHYFPLFYAGMIARKISLFDLLVEKQWWFKLFLIVVLVVARFATGWNILNIGLMISMIMILVDVQEYISERVLKVFHFLGKMSMNMWLIHMFFIAYGYHLANPITDLVWIYLESLGAAYVVWKLYNRLCGCLK